MSVGPVIRSGFLPQRPFSAVKWGPWCLPRFDVGKSLTQYSALHKRCCLRRRFKYFIPHFSLLSSVEWRITCNVRLCVTRFNVHSTPFFDCVFTCFVRKFHMIALLHTSFAWVFKLYFALLLFAPYFLKKTYAFSDFLKVILVSSVLFLCLFFSMVVLLCISL